MKLFDPVSLKNCPHERRLLINFVEFSSKITLRGKVTEYRSNAKGKQVSMLSRRILLRNQPDKIQKSMKPTMAFHCIPNTSARLEPNGMGPDLPHDTVCVKPKAGCSALCRYLTPDFLLLSIARVVAHSKSFIQLSKLVPSVEVTMGV
jgi:hypothetical protein